MEPCWHERWKGVREGLGKQEGHYSHTRCGLEERRLHRKLLQTGNQLCGSGHASLSPVIK